MTVPRLRITVVIQELDVDPEEARGAKLSEEVNATTDHIDDVMSRMRDTAKVVFGCKKTGLIEELEQAVRVLRLELDEARERAERAKQEAYRMRDRLKDQMIRREKFDTRATVPMPASTEETFMKELEKYRKR